MAIIKEYLLPFIFICIASAVFGALGFFLFAGFVLLALKVALEISYSAALIMFVSGLALLLLLVIRIIYKVYRKDV